MLLSDTWLREVKIAFIWSLTSSFLHLSSCFLKEPEQHSREWCRVFGILEGPEAKLPHLLLPGVGHWEPCSVRRPSAGQCMQHVQSSLQLLKPLHWLTESTRNSPSKQIHLWVSCTWEQNIASCQRLAERHWWTLLSAMTLWLFEDVLCLWRRNNLFYSCSF